MLILQKTSLLESLINFSKHSTIKLRNNPTDNIIIAVRTSLIPRWIFPVSAPSKTQLKDVVFLNLVSILCRIPRSNICKILENNRIGYRVAQYFLQCFAIPIFNSCESYWWFRTSFMGDPFLTAIPVFVTCPGSRTLETWVHKNWSEILDLSHRAWIVLPFTSTAALELSIFGRACEALMKGDSPPWYPGPFSHLCCNCKDLKAIFSCLNKH